MSAPEPFLIEVNNHDCISTLQLYEVQHSPHRTAILDKWVETMLYRSYQYMLKDQNILMIAQAGADFSRDLFSMTRTLVPPIPQA